MFSPNQNLISPREALNVMVNAENTFNAIDVRSSGEFATGQIRGFANLPILTNEERHLVGLCFKNQGQTAAIELGHQVVAKQREVRVTQWLDHLRNNTHSFVTCWRGGLRSEIAARWIAEAGAQVTRVEGGYKGLRHELLKNFESLPEFVVLAGATGSGKTKMLNEIALPKIDLEKIAVHRGSAFGNHVNVPQPAQATFENDLALDIMVERKKPGAGKVLIEDESRFVGKVYLNTEMHDAISQSAVVKIMMPIDDRVLLLFDEYVARPLNSGLAASALSDHYMKALDRIKNKLGGLMLATIGGELKDAFLQNEIELHHRWIKNLLVHYYDKMYEHSFAKNPRKILFQGEWHECKNWLLAKFG